MAKKIKKEKAEETYRKGEVITVLESMDDGIKFIAETQSELVKKVDKLQEDFNEMRQDVTEIKFDLKRKVSYDEFEKLEKRVVKLERAYAK